MLERQRVLGHIRRVGIAPDGEVVVLLEVGRQVGPAADREHAAREVVGRLRGHADGEEVAPALTHRPALRLVRPEALPDQPVGDVVAHLVEGDQRLVVAGAAGQRVGAVEPVHLHARAGPVGRRGHVGVVGAAEVVPLGQDRVAADAAEPEVVLLRVAGRLVETGLVPAVVQPVHVEEHADQAVLQVIRVGRGLGVVVLCVERARRGDLAIDIAGARSRRGT